MINTFPIKDKKGETQFFQAYSIDEELPEQGGVFLGIIHETPGMFKLVYIDKTHNLKERVSTPLLHFELKRHGVNYILFQNAVQDDLRDCLYEELRGLYPPTMNFDL